MASRGMGVLVVLALLLSFQTHVRGNRAAQASGESVAAELVQYAEPKQVTHIMGVSNDIFLNLRLDNGVRLQSASAETVDYYLPWPAGKSLYVIQGNNSSPTHTHSGNFEYAWDFTEDKTGTKEGHPIVAVADGIVRVAKKDEDSRGYGWGWYVVIEHQEPDGTPKYSLYGHLKAIDPGVQVNQPIGRGEPVGKLGRTGSAGLPEYGNVAHLHFQFMDAIYEGEYTARSVRATFKDVSGDGVPEEGKWYESKNCARQKAVSPCVEARLLNAPAYDVVLPGEFAQVSLEVKNAGILPWEVDQGYALKAVGEPPQDLVIVLPLQKEVLPGEKTTWLLHFPVTAGGLLRQYDFRMHFQETPFGPTLTAYVFILPERLGNLEEQIRQRIEEWRRQGEQEIDELIQEILTFIQEELERQAINWLERILKEICGGAGGAFALSLTSVWLARRRS